MINTAGICIGTKNRMLRKYFPLELHNSCEILNFYKHSSKYWYNNSLK